MTLPPDFSFRLLDASTLAATVACVAALVSAVLHFRAPDERSATAKWGALASRVAFLVFVAGMAASLAGVAVRWTEVNHYPVQTMFEALTTTASALFVSYFVLYFVTGLQRARGVVRGVGDLFLAIVMAGEVGIVVFANSLEAGPRTLPPALQSYWMPFHVSSLLLAYVTLSIAYVACLLYFTLKLVRQAFGGGPPLSRPMKGAAVAAFLGFVFLTPFAQVANIAVFVPVALVGLMLAKSGRLARLDSWIDGFDRFSFQIFGVGFPFLTAGLLMGAFWAQEAWALYWGWDSKETAALISWLIYVVFLHLRFVAGWRGERSLWVILAGAVSILVTFQLFNYLPASQDSLHKYTDGVSREGTELSSAAEKDSMAR